MRIPSEVVIKARSLRMGNGVSVLPSCLSAAPAGACSSQAKVRARVPTAEAAI